MPQLEENEVWQLPEALRITNPDVLERADRMARELAVRVGSPFGSLSPQEHERANAAIMVGELQKNLTHIKHLITEIVVDGTQDEDADKLHELKEARHVISSRLAEAYASTGRFDLAAELEPRVEMRAEYLEILEAINREDGEWCECAPGRDHVLRDVLSLRHGMVVAVRRCSGCKTLNAGPLPAHIAEQRAHRARAAALVVDKTPEEAKAMLMAAGHTTERLIPK